MERTPMRSYEASQMMFLMGLAQEADKAANQTLKNRLAMVGKQTRIAEIAQEVSGICSDVLSTVPVEKLRTLQKNLECVEMQTNVKRVVDDGKNEFTYVPSNAMRRLCAIASKDRCGMCLRTAEDAKNCKFRKLMQEIYMVDLPSGYGCEYGKLDWHEWEE